MFMSFNQKNQHLAKSGVNQGPLIVNGPRPVIFDPSKLFPPNRVNSSIFNTGNLIMNFFDLMPPTHHNTITQKRITPYLPLQGPEPALINCPK